MPQGGDVCQDFGYTIYINLIKDYKNGPRCSILSGSFLCITKQALSQWKEL